MEYTELGDTSQQVSVLGLGAGGSSKIGLGADGTERDARRLVETAIDHGITLIDTAEVYGTEAVIGEAIAGENREDLVLSTKFRLYDDGDLRPPEDLAESLEASLDRLGTDYVDVYHLHGVGPDDYAYAAEELYPELARLRAEGRIRAIGITESTGSDPSHETLRRAVQDDLWDVMMVGFNLLNHSARERVLRPAAEKGIGTIGMVAVRRALSDPEALAETIDELIATGELDPDAIDLEDPFGFLLREDDTEGVDEDGATDLIDAAYRFCRHEPTLDTVLTGTSSPDHLASNVESVLRGPLPEADLALLEERFGDVDSVIGN